MTDDVVLYEVRGRVGVITLNRPEVRNSVNAAVSERMAQVLDEFEAADDVWLGIVTGAGDVFSAGADLKALSLGENVRGTQPGGFAGITERSVVKPLIAAVNGYAVAGGCEIALSCDLIVAAEDAQFGLPEVRRAIIAAAGGVIRLPRRIPYHVAMEIALTGQFISAQRAYEVGLVNRVVPHGLALAAATELADVILANGPLAVRDTKAIVKESIDLTEEEAFARQAGRVARVFQTEDAKEGPRAFVEKRPPVWKAR